MPRLSSKDRADVLAIATGQKPKARRPRSSYREFAEQSMFAQWCDLALTRRGIRFSATMQGIHLPPLQAKLAKAKGVRKGQPDFYVFCPSAMLSRIDTTHIGLALEFKDPLISRKPTAEQLAWASDLRRAGWLVVVVTTFVAARDLTCEYLGIRG